VRFEHGRAFGCVVNLSQLQPGGVEKGGSTALRTGERPSRVVLARDTE